MLHFICRLKPQFFTVANALILDTPSFSLRAKQHLGCGNVENARAAWEAAVTHQGGYVTEVWQGFITMERCAELCLGVRCEARGCALVCAFLFATAP